MEGLFLIQCKMEISMFRLYLRMYSHVHYSINSFDSLTQITFPKLTDKIVQNIFKFCKRISYGICMFVHYIISYGKT